ncbi:hypothetical protein [Georgenia sp. AZ-5]|uniref:hypothetical protein n=1 Tax=Georgenia sp. AZ-5 TaxID=3367526 RepID=UPI0037543473
MNPAAVLFAFSGLVAGLPTATTGSLTDDLGTTVELTPNDDSFDLGVSRRESRMGEGHRGGPRNPIADGQEGGEPACGQYVNVGGFNYQYRYCDGDFTPVDEFSLTPAPGEVGEGDLAQPVLLTLADLRELPIAPGGLNIQPDQGWVLINVDTIFWTEAAEQTFDTVVLGTPVQVRVAPVDYAWDFGDGAAPLRTTDPGAPYPDHTVAHAYTRSSDRTRVTLTTRWAGEFQVAGSGVWQPVEGLATTTEVSAPFEVRTAQTALTVR